MLSFTTRFSPIRLTAHTRNEIELEITVKNDGVSPNWIECDVIVPEAISLASDKLLIKGRTRVGIAIPQGSISKKVRIYGNASTYPDSYLIRLTVFAFGSDGVVAQQQETKAYLRCERV